MTCTIYLVICLPAALSSDYSPHHGLELDWQQQHISSSSEKLKTEVGESKKTNFSSSIYANQTTKHSTKPTIQGGEATDTQSRDRRKFVKEMMKHAWDGYAAHAWGKNEVRPVSKIGNLGTVFGSSDCGATIVDSMDTLYIMGLEEEFAKGKEWISTNLNLTQMTEKISVFETNIRYVGELLSVFALTGDDMFKTKAIEIVEKLLPAFATPTGVPHGRVDMRTGVAGKGDKNVLSELGTLHMEFSYLSDITGNTIYKEKVETVRDFLDKKEKPNNLYPNYLNVKTGLWGQNHVSLGALGDSFYEYLLKEWLRSGMTDEQAKRMFVEAATDLRGGRLEHKMDHLACFAGGMFALAAREEEDDIVRRKWMRMAEGITTTCHQSYENTVTKLGPEVIRFDGSYKPLERSYLLRPG